MAALDFTLFIVSININKYVQHNVGADGYVKLYDMCVRFFMQYRDKLWISLMPLCVCKMPNLSTYEA